MPYRLDTHVLTVDANVIHKVDTANPANLFSMWTVFSRCADSVEQGRRLENLSWRLWQREQLLEKNHQASSNLQQPTATMQAQAQDVPIESKLPDMPQLSGSVESLQDDEAVEFTSVSAPLAIRPRIRRLESSSGRSKRDRHISSDDFEKMIVSIVKDKAPLSAPTRSSSVLAAPTKPLPLASAVPTARPRPTTPESRSPQLSDRQSEASLACLVARPVTNVVRGFSPPTASITTPQTVQTSAPESTSLSTTSAATSIVQLQKQPATAALEKASCSPLGEQGQSADKEQPALAVSVKKPVFQIGGSSSEEGSLKIALLSPRPASSSPKKQASFSKQVDTRTIAPSESAVDSDTEYVDESAIDDSSDWEDSVEDSNKSSMDEKIFQRVPSKANLTSRPSLITLMLAQDERAKKLSNESQSMMTMPRPRVGPGTPTLGVSPNDSDEGPLMKGMRHSILNSISEVPRSSAQPISVGANCLPAQAALSPRTTRRNMLATELTESLRRHLLWERQQKTSTANAVLKRRYTAQDVASLRQFPVRPCLKDGEDENLNKVFSKEALKNYHSKGW